MTRAATALTIAGSDSGGGAGIQADLKTFSALGVYGTSAITAITAQNTRGVVAVEPVSPAGVRAQILAVLDDVEIGAVKTGMLASAAIVEAVADALGRYAGPVILDPVMVSKSGDPLLDEDAVVGMTERLLPRSDLVTPNLPEAARLLGTGVAAAPDDVEEQGRALLELGPAAVLMKGGHAHGPSCTDRLVTGHGISEMTMPRLLTRNTHGTGCSLSSAVAAELAKGAAMEQAFRRAQCWLHGAIGAADGLRIGSGNGPVHHFHELWP